MPLYSLFIFFISGLLRHFLLKNQIPTIAILDALSVIHSLYLLLTTRLLHNAVRIFKVSTVIAMACSKLSKITKQHEKTRSLLHKRFVEMEFNFHELFNDNVWEFLQKKAASLSTSAGYLVPCILTSTAFVASTGSLISYKQYEIPVNLYFIFVCPPSTGKSRR